MGGGPGYAIVSMHPADLLSCWSLIHNRLAASAVDKKLCGLLVCLPVFLMIPGRKYLQ